jgi:hypothetical protein
MKARRGSSGPATQCTIEPATAPWCHILMRCLGAYAGSRDALRAGSDAHLCCASTAGTPEINRRRRRLAARLFRVNCEQDGAAG